MTVFVNTVNPQLRILLPDGSYAQFQGGKLEADEDDFGYAEVLAEAQRNPSISIMVNSTTCEYCGKVFTGKPAKAQLGAHIKGVHPDVWDHQQALERAKFVQAQIKSRAGFACDVCAPIQTFGTENDLAGHVNALHTRPPDLDEQGNTVGGSESDGGGRRPGEVDPPAPARRKG